MDRIQAGVAGRVKPAAREYSMLEEHDTDDEPRAQSGIRRRRWLPLAASFLVGVLITALASSARDSILSRKPAAAANRNIPEMRPGTDAVTGLPLSWSHGDCGNSAAEAAARGCRYSIVLHAWLPASCLTADDAADELLMYRGRDWAYEAGGRNLTLDELRGGRFHHFTTGFDWHVAHCMYVWKRMHRAMLDASRGLDSYTANLRHTGHCVAMIGGGSGHEGMRDAGTKIFVKFPVCA